MVKTLFRWSLRLAILVGVVTLLGRALAGRGGNGHTRVAGSGRGAFPSITGDTWPPVPVNPDRED